MAENDSGEKTEDATEHRRSEARQDGNVAKSTDVNAAVIMLTAAAGLMFLAPAMGQGLAQMMVSYLSGPAMVQMDLAGSVREFHNIIDHVVGFLVPFLGLMFCAAIIANIMQIGFLFTTKPLNLKWDRLSPLAGAKRIFSVSSIAKLGTSIGKVIVMVTISSFFIYVNLPMLLGLGTAEPNVILGVLGAKILELSFQLALAMLMIAILDFSFQKWKHEKDLKMTKQEIRDEMKNMDGDPQMRQRRKEAHRKLATAKEMNSVKDADVVVTNPTHISVALKYDPDKNPAPIVVAKGAGEIALRIRQLAREHNVPIIERKPLARAIYRDVKVGRPIPADMYEVFVEIMAYVYRLTGKTLPER